MKFDLTFTPDEFDIIRMALTGYSLDNDQCVESMKDDDEHKQSQIEYGKAIDLILEKFERLYNNNQ